MSMHRIDEYLTVLSDCPYLLSCMFEGVEDDIHATSRFRQSVLRHSHLRVKHIPCFFDCLAMPKLRTIHLVSMTMYAFYEAVFHFLSRSSRTIVKLIWDVGRVIRIMPELEELEITRHCETEITRQLLLDLTVNPHSQNSVSLLKASHCSTICFR
jgi:hypothetical protein